MRGKRWEVGTEKQKKSRIGVTIPNTTGQSSGSSIFGPKPYSPLLLTFYFSFLTFLLYGCGYTLQTRANLPFESVAVGKIENKTVEPKLQDRFNRQLSDTFAEYGFYVGQSSRYVLDGEITQFELRPRAEANLIATQYEVVITANFRLVDTLTGRSFPLIAQSPFITYFGSTGSLESVLAQKELSTNSALKNLSQEVVRRIAYDTPKDFAYLLFTTQDIKDLDGLVVKLRDAENPLSVHLRERFSLESRRLLDEYDGSKKGSEQLRNILSGELNQIIQGVTLFDEKRFAHLALSGETRKLAESNPTGTNRIRLNRQLLEEAYPQEIAKAQKDTEGERLLR